MSSYEKAIDAGRQVNRESMAGRPDDQPSGPAARLLAIHWLLDPSEGAEIMNLRELFSEGVCPQCIIPHGVRTARPMRIRFMNASSRRSDGLLAQPPERLLGPTYGLYSDRFISLLSEPERKTMHWRPVDVANPTRTTRAFYEVAGSSFHFRAIALRGGNAFDDLCQHCGSRDDPHFPGTGGLPTWLNPTSDLGWSGQPSRYLSAADLPDPMPSWFTVGDWNRGVSLGMSSHRFWPKRSSAGIDSISLFGIGVVPSWLVQGATDVPPEHGFDAPPPVNELDRMKLDAKEDDTPTDSSHLVVARMYEHIEPLDRGERYEDPLQSALDVAGFGATITGGGSSIERTGRIEYVEVEIELDRLGDALDAIAGALNAAGAPRGSELIVGDEVIRTFGTRECLGIYLDGVSLSDEVYAELDFEDVVARIGALAGPDSYHGYWQGAEETGLFFFGDDAEAMFRSVEPLLLELPIGQNARVVIRDGAKGEQPRTTRIPRR